MRSWDELSPAICSARDLDWGECSSAADFRLLIDTGGAPLNQVQTRSGPVFGLSVDDENGYYPHVDYQPGETGSDLRFCGCQIEYTIDRV